MKTLFALLCAASTLALAQPATAPVRNRAPLATTPYTLLPLGSIQPQGWLKRQLEIQAAGLSGHVEEIWKDLGPTSGWLGGTGESWERGPYYLDGLIPLAYELNNPELIARAKKWVEWTLVNQRPDGAIGPVKNDDWWPKFVMLKALIQYQEASGDARVVPLMERYFAYQAALLDKQPLKEWAIVRWQDEALAIYWLYNRTGNAKLLDLVRKLHAQGYYWPEQFKVFNEKTKVTGKQAHLLTHGVNNSQGLKTGAIWWQLSGDRNDLDMTYHQLRTLDQYHLQPAGVHAADEHYAGLDPSQGTELCSVLEMMYSLEHMIAATADATLAERLEKVAYNAQPATFTKDMWGHQYDQQANQVLVSRAKRNWSSNGDDSNLYGLEPNFGCCLANMHQGWPKLTSSLWMATRDEGLAAVVYAPSAVSSVVRGGVRVTIDEQTGYPFRKEIHLTVNPERAATFPLELRIPSWANAAEVRVNGALQTGATPGAFFKIERQWAKGDKVDVVFPMQVRVVRGYRDSAVVERGPLVYSLRIGEQWSKVVDRGPASDWAVAPTTPWNYALLDNQTFEVEERVIGEYPFSTDGAPVVVKAKARRVADWTLVDNSAATVPASPVATNAAVETVDLIPYGAAKLRVTAFPVTK